MEDKVRVYEIAEESGATSGEVIGKAIDLGLELKSVQSAVSFEDAEEIVKYIMTGKSKLLNKKEPEQKTVIKKKIVAEEEIINEKKSTPTIKEKAPKKKVVAKKTEEKVIKPKLKVVKTGLRKVVKKESKAIKKEETVLKVEEKVSTPSIQTEPIKKETPKVETVAKIVSNDAIDKVVLKKRGLTIVKKSKPVITHPSSMNSGENSKKQAMKSMSELFGKTPELKETYNSRARKQTKRVPARSHEHGKVLHVDTSADFKASDDSIMGEEIMLHDMNLMETSKFLQEPPRKKQTDQNKRPNRPSAFGNRPRGLKRGGKKKKYTPKIEVEDITEVTIPEDCRVYEFAEKIGKSAGDVIGKLFMLGMMVTKNDFLGNDEIEILGEEFEIEITI